MFLATEESLDICTPCNSVRCMHVAMRQISTQRAHDDSHIALSAPFCLLKVGTFIRTTHSLRNRDLLSA